MPKCSFLDDSRVCGCLSIGPALCAFLFDDLHTVFFFVSFLVMPTRARALPLPHEDVLLVRRGSSTGSLFLRNIA